MSQDTKAFFDVQYAPVGSSTRKFSCLERRGVLERRGRDFFCAPLFDFGDSVRFATALIHLLTVFSYSQDWPHRLQPLRQRCPQDRPQLP